MEYIHLQSKYFIAFIDTDKYATVEAYIEEMRKDKIWGDNIEIQAMSELYGSPVELYEYDIQPSRTFGGGGQVMSINDEE